MGGNCEAGWKLCQVKNRPVLWEKNCEKHGIIVWILSAILCYFVKLLWNHWSYQKYLSHLLFSFDFLIICKMFFYLHLGQLAKMLLNCNIDWIVWHGSLFAHSRKFVFLCNFPTFHPLFKRWKEWGANVFCASKENIWIPEGVQVVLKLMEKIKNVGSSSSKISIVGKRPLG